MTQGPWPDPLILELWGLLEPENAFSYTIKLNQATRDGATIVHILTNLPRRVSGKRVADLYLKRWTVETAFQHLEAYFHSEINTLGYPKVMSED